jgi:hypothetical protein
VIVLHLPSFLRGTPLFPIAQMLGILPLGLNWFPFILASHILRLTIQLLQYMVKVKRKFSPSSKNWGHPLKGTCQEEKPLRKQEEAFFLGERCGCENGPFFSSSEQPPPYRLFCSRSNLLPTLHGSLRVFSC